MLGQAIQYTIFFIIPIYDEVVSYNTDDGQLITVRE